MFMPRWLSSLNKHLPSNSNVTDTSRNRILFLHTHTQSEALQIFQCQLLKLTAKFHVNPMLKAGCSPISNLIMYCIIVLCLPVQQKWTKNHVCKEQGCLNMNKQPLSLPATMHFLHFYPRTFWSYYILVSVHAALLSNHYADPKIFHCFF